jgi:hypothetical protein
MIGGHVDHGARAVAAPLSPHCSLVTPAEVPPIARFSASS